MFHNNLKTDSAKKKRERVERARATRKAYWYKKKHGGTQQWQAGTKKNG